MPSAATSLVASVNSVTKLRQLLVVGPPLITPNMYAQPNISVDDWHKRSGVVSADDFHEKNRQSKYIRIT